MSELLAPVGSRDALIAAIEGGANAIYLGGKMFGARHYAPNFTDEELAEAVRIAHLKEVSVYVTVNTLIDNNEFGPLIDYLKYLYLIGVDAIIVQDVGVARIARAVVPEMQLHASTQMTVHNLEGVKLLASLGFKRVVLAREMSLDDIRKICAESPIEIEVFIHGALCISYSGQCLMSSLIGGRSGNRGKCAQPCRLPYTLVNRQGENALPAEDAGNYLLSPKDFNTLELLPDLIGAGVASLKIEGRMKRPEYVAVVVDTYRRAIDSYRSAKEEFHYQLQDQKDLAQIFNRGFTTAYLKGKQGRNMMSDRRPNNRGVRAGRILKYFSDSKTALIKLEEDLHIGDILEFWVKVGGRVSAEIAWIKINDREVANAIAGTEALIPVKTVVRPNDRAFKVFDALLMEKARSFFGNNTSVSRIPVTATVEAVLNKPLKIILRDPQGNIGTAQTEFICEKALKRPINEELVNKQLERMGNTVFYLETLTCNIEGELMVPVSEINEARRQAVEALEKARLLRYDRSPLPAVKVEISQLLPPMENPSKGKRTELNVNVDSLEKVSAALRGGADWILFGGDTYDHRTIPETEYKRAIELVRKQGKKIILNTPRLAKPWQMDEISREMQFFNELQPDAINVCNLGTLSLARRLSKLPIFGDYSLNAYNAAAIAFFKDLGLHGLTLSPELNFTQVENLGRYSGIELECIIHGRLELMISEYCTMGSFLGDLHSGPCKQVCTKEKYWLKDRKDEVFPLATDQFCRMHLLNAKEMSMLPHVYRFQQSGITRIRLEGKYETPGAVGKIVSLYRRILDAGVNWEDLQPEIDAIENNDVTRGHYFRGVL